MYVRAAKIDLGDRVILGPVGHDRTSQRRTSRRVLMVKREPGTITLTLDGMPPVTMGEDVYVLRVG